MGVTLETYRRRIGCFGPGRGYGGARPSTETYDGTTGNTDIHFRVFLTALLLTSILFVCERTLVYGIHEMSLSAALGRDICGGAISITSSMTIFEQLYTCPGNRLVTSTEADMTYHSNGYICERLLTLSADVEMNPGPSTDEMETILKAINDSEKRVLDEIRTVKNEMASIKTDLAEVKEDCVKTKLGLNQLQQSHLQTKTDVKNAKKDIKELHDLRHQMQLDIDQLNDDFHEKVDLLQQMENDIDVLDAKSRNDTMRIFGLEERGEESYNELRTQIIENVLKIACPEETWERDDIKRAFRAGEATGEKPRMIIMKFRYDDDKYRIYTGRDMLRERGIRVGNDLTRRQREKLKSVKQTGRLGYFYRGKLQLFDESAANAGPGGKASKRRRLGDFSIQDDSERMAVDDTVGPTNNTNSSNHDMNNDDR